VTRVIYGSSDPDSVVREPWGSLEIIFDGCDTATAHWNGPPAYGSGSMDLAHLSFIDDIGCRPGDVSQPDRIISGRSGAWLDPAHDGEGWMLETLSDMPNVRAAGADDWVLGLAPPVAVHGTTGAVVNGEFVIIAGSDIAGELSLNRATQLLTPDY